MCIRDRDKGSSQRRTNKPESKRSWKETRDSVVAYSDSLKERYRVLAGKSPAATFTRKASQSSERSDAVKRIRDDGGKPEPADTFKRKASSESERLDARKNRVDADHFVPGAVPMNTAESLPFGTLLIR